MLRSAHYTAFGGFWQLDKQAEEQKFSQKVGYANLIPICIKTICSQKNAKNLKICNKNNIDKKFTICDNNNKSAHSGRMLSGFQIIAFIGPDCMAV